MVHYLDCFDEGSQAHELVLRETHRYTQSKECCAIVFEVDGGLDISIVKTVRIQDVEQLFADRADSVQIYLQ